MAVPVVSAGEEAVHQMADALREEMMVEMLNSMQSTASKLADIASEHLEKLRQVMLAEFAEKATSALPQLGTPQKRDGAQQCTQIALEEPQKPGAARTPLTETGASDAVKEPQNKLALDGLLSTPSVDARRSGAALTSPAPTESTRAWSGEALPESPLSSEMALSGLRGGDKQAAAQLAARLSPVQAGSDANDEEGSESSQRDEEALGCETPSTSTPRREVPPGGSPGKKDTLKDLESAVVGTPLAAKAVSGSSSGGSSVTSTTRAGSECTQPLSEPMGGAGEDAAPLQRSPVYGAASGSSEARAAANTRRRGFSTQLQKRESGLSSENALSRASTKAESCSDTPPPATGQAPSGMDDLLLGRQSRQPEPEDEEEEEDEVAEACASSVPAEASASPERVKLARGGGSGADVAGGRGGGAASTAPTASGNETKTQFLMTDSDDDACSAKSDDDFISRGWDEWETVDKERQARERLEQRFAAEQKAKKRRPTDPLASDNSDEEDNEDDEEDSADERAREEQERAEAAERERQKERQKAEQRARLDALVCKSCRRRSVHGKFGDGLCSKDWYCMPCWTQWDIEDSQHR